MKYTLTAPFDEKIIRQLRAGDQVELSGVVYTGRDAAHKRLVAILDNGGTMPVDLAGQAIYFVGPCPAPPGRPIGSAGPTTSGRMDAYSPRLIAECGLRGMIGKGDRNEAVKNAMKEYGCVYFAATGGAGALIADSTSSFANSERNPFMRSLSNCHPKLFADEKYVPLERRVTMECHFGNPPRELQTLVFYRRE